MRLLLDMNELGDEGPCEDGGEGEDISDKLGDILGDVQKESLSPEYVTLLGI